ncbi:MAG: hypothetical protein ACRCWG_00030 [Sarcina sp.]
MKFKFLTVLIGAFFLVGCGSKIDSQVEAFKMNLSSEKYNVASEIYKKNKEDESFLKYANEFIENDIIKKEEYLNRGSYVEIEEDINGILSFYNSESLINVKNKIKDLKLEVVLENKKLVQEKKYLEEELEKFQNSNVSDGTFSYQAYNNEKYGLKVEYPSIFTNVEENEEKSSLKISTSDGNASMLFEGWEKSKGENVDDMYENAINTISNMPYKEKGENTYVISWREGEFVYYKSVIVKETVVNSFIMKYPVSEQSLYNPILDSTYTSFVTSDSNEFYQ